MLLLLALVQSGAKQCEVGLPKDLPFGYARLLDGLRHRVGSIARANQKLRG